MRILFVDDNKDITDMFCLCFCMMGHTAQGAFSADEAIQAIEQNPGSFDVAILDYHMPDMHGIEAARHIKQKLSGRNIPLILYTGHSGSDIGTMAHNAGIARVVYKRMTPEQLLAIIDSVVEAQNH